MFNKDETNNVYLLASPSKEKNNIIKENLNTTQQNEELIKENQELKNKIIELNSIINELKLGSVVQESTNVENDRMGEFNCKLAKDNKYLKKYIQKVEELMKGLEDYKMQISSMTIQIKQKTQNK